jgi:hypothetical protein
LSNGRFYVTSELLAVQNLQTNPAPIVIAPATGRQSQHPSAMALNFNPE